MREQHIYKEHLKISKAQWTLIDHEDSMVATECQNHLSSSLIEKCREYYEKHAEILLSTDGPCVIHRDFRPGNLIVSDSGVQGVIDWSSARGGFAEEDFCPLEFGEWSNPNSSCKGAFLAGYASIRKVPEYTVV